MQCLKTNTLRPIGTNYMRKTFTEFYTTIYKQPVEFFEKMYFISLSYNALTSPNRKAYLSVTNHLFSSPYNLNEVAISIICISDRHTGDVIAEFTLEIIKEYNIAKKCVLSKMTLP